MGLSDHIKMIIYTGQTTGVKLGKIIERNMGVMISSNPNTSPSKEVSKVRCALDNGAFTCDVKGYPFQEDVFLRTMAKSYANGIKLDFIVCPDIIARGKESLKFSLGWAKRLRSAPNLALVLQDGMAIEDINTYVLSHFTYLFMGGTVKWKWDTASDWVKFARDKNKKIHIGQCGQLKHLKKAKALGVDSVDSVSFTVNDSFNIIDEFYNELKLSI